MGFLSYTPRSLSPENLCKTAALMGAALALGVLVDAAGRTLGHATLKSGEAAAGTCCWEVRSWGRDLLFTLPGGCLKDRHPPHQEAAGPKGEGAGALRQ